jgi:hypothetical protein
VLAFVVLPLVSLSLPVAAQSSVSNSAGDNASPALSQYSAAPISPPLTIETPDVSTQVPAAQLNADPIPTAPAVASPEALGPAFSAATAGFHAHSATLSRQQLAERAAAAHGAVSTSGILMIIGGAGFIAGLIIGGGAGTAIAIAGAVMALYGLYLYLR